MGSRSRALGWLCACILFVAPSLAHAKPLAVTFRHDHHLFTLVPSHYPHWSGVKEVWMYGDKEIEPLALWRSDGDEDIELPEEIHIAHRKAWDRQAIRETLLEQIAREIDRDPGSVTIERNSEGEITFEGVGLLGRYVRLDEAVDLTIFALENAVYDIVLPMDIVQPEIHVADSQLRSSGVKEVLAVGESNFSGSPYNRRHNIAVGLGRFNGHIVPKGEQFSFNAALGPVNEYTGYKPELVILGDKTLPEYGGGLCQVSTTAYRGVWEYGFPIEQRRNHSFAVQYYSPQGTDATIYPPHTDMKFLNDSPADILIQTHVEGDNAYFIYYGSLDDRNTEIAGPFNWDHKPAPPDRTEYTTELPPGERLKVGSAVPGLRSAWFRTTSKGESSVTEEYYSIYEARPLYYQIGIAGEPVEEEEQETVVTEEDLPLIKSIRKNTPRFNPRSLRR